MTVTDETNPLEPYRSAVERPLLRLFRAYGPGDGRWLVLGGGALLQWVRGVAMNFFAHGVMYAVRTDAYEKMQRLDMTFFDNKETGEVMSILNNDTGNLEVFFDNALGDSVRMGVIVVGITATLLYTNWQLALGTLGAVPLLVGFTWWFMRAIEPRYATHHSMIGDLNTRIENGLSGIELVKTTSTEAYENERVRGVSRDVFDAQMDVLKLSYFYRLGMELITGAALLATFVIGGLWVFSGPPLFFSGGLTTGDFVVFMLLTQRLTGPMAQLSNIVDWYENARASGKRICGLMDVPVRIEDAPDPVALESVGGHVEYDDVTFAYETDDAPSAPDRTDERAAWEPTNRYSTASTSWPNRARRSPNFSSGCTIPLTARFASTATTCGTCVCPTCALRLAT